VNMAKRELRIQEQNILSLESQLVKFLSRLGEALPNLPKSYWQFVPLKSSTLSLIIVLMHVLENMAEKKSLIEVSASIETEAVINLSAFEKFRSMYSKSESFSFNFEEIHQMFTAIQSLQRCAEITKNCINALTEAQNTSL